MKSELISICQMFLVPSSIMFAALGVAGSEALKSLICGAGSFTSLVWLWTINQWNNPEVDTTPFWALSLFFTAAWIVCLIAHLVIGFVWGWWKQKEVQWTWTAPAHDWKEKQ
jgi:hypothetical protein